MELRLYVYLFFSQVVVELGKSERKEIILSSLQDGPLKLEEQKKQAYQFLKKQELFSDVKTAVAVDQYPILLWWSPLTGETGRLGECGEDLCFFTINRTYQHNHMTRAFLFYGKELVHFK